VEGSPGLFFGKGGVNVAAAAKLTRVRINIKV
jgi:transcription antitermination factor NusA-like protein